MSFVVKAVLLKKENENSEFRRFKVDENINYVSLKEKIVKYFPDVDEFLWTDTDGDMITFSSDEELQEALKSVSDGVFKLFVVEKKSNLDEISFNNAELRPKWKGRRMARKVHAMVSSNDEDNLNWSRAPSTKRFSKNITDKTHGKPGKIRIHCHSGHGKRRFAKIIRMSGEDNEQWFKRRQRKWLERHQDEHGVKETEPDTVRQQGNINEHHRSKGNGDHLKKLNEEMAKLQMSSLTQNLKMSKKMMENESPRVMKGAHVKLTLRGVGSNKYLVHFGRKYPKYAFKTCKRKEISKYRGTKGILTSRGIERSNTWHGFIFERSTGTQKKKLLQEHGKSDFLKMIKGLQKMKLKINDNYKHQPLTGRLGNRPGTRVPVQMTPGLRIGQIENFRRDGIMHGKRGHLQNGNNIWKPREKLLKKSLKQVEERKQRIQSRLDRGCRHTSNRSTHCGHCVNSTTELAGQDFITND